MSEAHIKKGISGFLDCHEYLYVAAIFIVLALLDIYFILKNSIPPAWDQSLHMTLAVGYSELFSSFDLTGMVMLSGFYPPFYHISTIPLLWLLGFSYQAAEMVNIIYLGILLFSVYGIGKILFDKRTAVLSVLIIGMYTYLMNMRRTYLLDFALVSIVALSVYFLLKTDRFRDLKYSIAFGAAAGLALLIKWPAVFFIAGPFIYELYLLRSQSGVCRYCGKKLGDDVFKKNGEMFCSKSHSHKSKEKQPQGSNWTRNLALSFLVGVALAGIWYFPHFGEVKNSLSEGQQYWGEVEGDPQVLSIPSFLYYINSVDIQISLFFSIIALAGLVFMYRESNEKRVFFYASIIIPYLTFTLLRNKDVRYTLPVLIFIAIASAFWIERVADRKLKLGIIGLILIIGSIQISTVTFGIPAINAPSIYPEPNSPKNEDWKVNDVLGAISSSLPGQINRPIFVVVIPDEPYVNGRTYELYRIIRKEPYTVINGAYLPVQLFKDNILGIDYIITKSGSQGTVYGELVSNLNLVFDGAKDNYIIIKEVKLPDNSTLGVYKNRNL